MINSTTADWGRYYGDCLVRALGFTRQPSCAATLHTVLSRVDREGLEEQLSAWVEGVLAVTPPAQDEEEPLAIDGKTLRGSQKQGAPGAYLLSVLAYRLGLTLAQQAVADKTNEIPVVLDLLRHVVVEGRVVTMDALLTQRHIAQQIVEARSHYVMVVQENQPQLRADIAPAPITGETRTVTDTMDCGHGRIEQRRLRTSDVLVGYSAWPGLAQVFQLERQVIVKQTGAVREAVVAGVTRLAPAQADAAHLLAFVRGPLADREPIPLDARRPLR